MAITAKTHPWRVTLLRDVETTIGPLVSVGLQSGHAIEIAPPRTIPQKAGERCYRTKRDAVKSAAAFRAEHGADVCTDPFKAAG